MTLKKTLYQIFFTIIKYLLVLSLTQLRDISKILCTDHPNVTVFIGDENSAEFYT